MAGRRPAARRSRVTLWTPFGASEQCYQCRPARRTASLVRTPVEALTTGAERSFGYGQSRQFVALPQQRNEIEMLLSWCSHEDLVSGGWR